LTGDEVKITTLRPVVVRSIIERKKDCVEKDKPRKPGKNDPSFGNNWQGKGLKNLKSGKEEKR